MFLKRTIDNVLENMRGDTEIISVLDGAWADPVIPDHPKVVLVHFTTPVGQRAATNVAARISKAKYVMKLDAHCALDEGFDVKLMADMQDDFTMVPRLYNLHAFDWECKKCGDRTYQGPTPKICAKCEGDTFERFIVWKPRLNRKSDFMMFDRDLVFQYWRHFGKRPEAKPDIAPLMSSLGACWMMKRRRFLYTYGGLDERHGSWGQMGTEIACKTWLSGGTQVVNKKTWYSHMFRTQGGDFGFPYKISGNEQERARKYSRDFWLNNKWKKAVRKFDWIIDKFAPIPTWEAR